MSILYSPKLWLIFMNFAKKFILIKRGRCPRHLPAIWKLRGNIYKVLSKHLSMSINFMFISMKKLLREDVLNTSFTGLELWSID